ncbi:nucleotidyltransferase family protein [Halorientalis pallida]|uniref:Nucleotidyltransferase family protein n=1 Tax=Halorientalis pallida TaxID=2479928 RepID=A0A498KUJ2_9EURY|nr:nucleotidyltransferase family protein [Halorientalis pallida]RXK47985.1 nucleotidyltransferase family protein [Halorientalis pallida]
MTRGELPVVDPPFDGSDQPAGRAEGTVVGVVLAAGTSTRYGARNKLLTEWASEPIVRHAARTVERSSLDATVVVVGHDAAAVRGAVEGRVDAVVRNERYAEGQDTSVERGVEAARDRDADAVLFALGDMPRVAVESVNRLVAAYHHGVGDALAVAHQGQRGNPVIFDSKYFPALSNVSGDGGGRQILLAADESALVETGDPGVLLDVDTPQHLEEL